jgi:lipopolysaccharide biosynthesis protein
MNYLNKTYLVFAHYHSNGKIREDIINLLKTLKPHFLKIIIVSTNLNKEEKQKISKYAKIIIRKNYGYDFYSYKVGIRNILKKEKNKKFSSKYILLLNSSILFLDTNKFLRQLKKMKFNKNCVNAITQSREIKKHLQSYFIFFPVSLLENNQFLNFWLKIRKFTSRQIIINKYELGFSALTDKINIKKNFLFTTNLKEYPSNIFKLMFLKILIKIKNSKKIFKKNPTFFYWEELFKQFGIIKVELIRNNPHNVNLNNLYKYFSKKRIIQIQNAAKSN